MPLRWWGISRICSRESSLESTALVRPSLARCCTPFAVCTESLVEPCTGISGALFLTSEIRPVSCMIRASTPMLQAYSISSIAELTSSSCTRVLQARCTAVPQRWQYLTTLSSCSLSKLCAEVLALNLEAPIYIASAPVLTAGNTDSSPPAGASISSLAIIFASVLAAEEGHLLSALVLSLCKS